MIMHMGSVNVRGYDRLNIITKVFSDKSLRYLMGKLGRDVFVISKTHNIVNRFHSSFACKWRRAVKAISCKMIINCFHLKICATGVGDAVDRGCKHQTLGLVGVQYVP